MAELQRVKASTIRRILAGDEHALEEINWCATPQGDDYWLEEFYNMHLPWEGGLSHEARAYLENLLANGRRVKQ